MTKTCNLQWSLLTDRHLCTWLCVFYETSNSGMYEVYLKSSGLNIPCNKETHNLIAKNLKKIVQNFFVPLFIASTNVNVDSLRSLNLVFKAT